MIACVRKRKNQPKRLALSSLSLKARMSDVVPRVEIQGDTWLCRFFEMCQRWPSLPKKG